MNNGVNTPVIVELLPQVRAVAQQMRKHLPFHLSQEDLEQAGAIGLMQAVEKFDPQKSVPIKAYARFRIRGAMLDSLRELDWSPRSLREKARLLKDARSRLSVTLSRDPEPAEIAAEVGLPLTEFWRVLAAVDTLEVQPLLDNDSTDVPQARDADPFFLCAQRETKTILAHAISQLSQSEREFLSLYYFEELTMKEVAAIIGVVESRISQIHARVLSKLRVHLRPSLGQKRRVSLNGRCSV